MRRSLAIGGALTGVLAAAVLVVSLGSTSSHNEAPGSVKDPSADWTDVYAFTPEEDPNSVVLIGNVGPFQLPQGGPNYNTSLDPKARYYLNVDNTGDGAADVRFRYEFKDRFKGTADVGYPLGLPIIDSINSANIAYQQTYKLTQETLNSRGDVRRSRKLAGAAKVAPANVGLKTIPDYDAVARGAIGRLSGGITSFVGAADDPFYIDLGATFDAVNLCRATGNEGGCVDDISGFNVNTLVLKIPENVLKGPGGPNIGVWATTERQNLQINEVGKTKTSSSQVADGSDGADYVQVNRLGNPLVNELVVPVASKDTFNSTLPKDDKQYAAAVLKPFPAAALNQLFNLGIKETDRTDIVTALLTGIPDVTAIGSNPAVADTLKLNMDVPPTPTAQENRFGVIGGDNAGFPNGRRLGDDVVDITLRVVGGYLIPEAEGGKKLPLGDGVDANDQAFRPFFPYVAQPQSGSGGADPADAVKLANVRTPVHAPTPGENPR